MDADVGVGTYLHMHMNHAIFKKIQNFWNEFVCQIWVPLKFVLSLGGKTETDNN